METADKCRAMGLKVGDTIEGREGDEKGTWWDVTRLTLLWLGQATAVWSQTHINHMNPEWSAPKEESHWCLDFRNWRKVTPNVEGNRPRK